MDKAKDASVRPPTCSTCDWCASLGGKHGHCYWRARGEPPPLIKPTISLDQCCERHPDIGGAADLPDWYSRKSGRQLTEDV